MTDFDILSQIGWLASASEPFRRSVLAKLDALEIQPGESVYLVGDASGGIYGVLDGEVEMHLAVPGSGPSLAFLCGPGFWFGDLAALTKGKRRFTIIARTASRLVRLSRSQMLRLCHDEPESWAEFARLAGHNMAITMDVAAALSAERPADRVAMFLLALTIRLPEKRTTVRASQADLATMCRLSRSSLSAALKKLERQGWIAVRYRAVEVIAPHEMSEAIGVA